jgi:hypothetical protein
MVIVVQNFNADNIEADYAWVYFTFQLPLMTNKEIYITGMFNNYSLTQNSKWIIIQKKNLRKAILIKQGFTNYEYTIADDSKGISIMKMPLMVIFIKPKMIFYFSVLKTRIDMTG